MKKMENWQQGVGRSDGSFPAHLRIDKACTTPWSQARGLMFSRRKTLLFIFRTPRRVRIHTCFVFFPITLTFLDRNKRVIERKQNLRPFRVYCSQAKAKYLIETPA